MTVCHFKPLAESDLEGIWLYTLENWTLKQADSYLSEILTGIEQLAVGVQKGRDVAIRDGYLKYKVGSHVIFYRNIDGMMEVVRILHQSMDFDRHLG